MQSRRRPREDEPRLLASHPLMHAKSSSHRAQPSDSKDLAKRHQAQSGANVVSSGSGSVLPASAGSSVRASSRAPAGNGPHEHGTALPAGAKAPGGAPSRAPWPAKQRSAQPAFIRIGDDNLQGNLRPLHTQTHPSPALGHPGDSRPGLSTAVSRFSHQEAAGAASATAPAAAASPAALLTTSSATSSFSHNAIATMTAPPPQAADVAVDCTATPQQGSDAHQHDRAETPLAALAANRAVSTDGLMTDVPAAAAATAASGAQMCVTVPEAAAQQHDRADTQRTTVRSAAVESTALGSAALGSTALGSAAIGSPGMLGSADTIGSAAAEPLAAARSAVTPSWLQSSAGAAASAPRAMLPTSRKKRKGPKAATKPEEPVQACHSWQALLGTDDIGKPEAPKTTLPAGTFVWKDLFLTTAFAARDSVQVGVVAFRPQLE